MCIKNNIDYVFLHAVIAPTLPLEKSLDISAVP